MTMRTLLIVDDVATNRAILTKILESEYRILTAADGKQALKILHDADTDISAVLLDLGMPVMDGFEVLSRMRADASLVHIPVIVTTGSTDFETEVRALSCGANDYVTKPYNQEVIRHRVRNTVNLRETAAAVNELRRDKLTGLPSREEFFSRAEKLIAAEEPGFYVMSCMDIEEFKVINDQYGTSAGDEVLRHIATSVDAYVTEHGGICCRVMADNFAILFPSSLIGSESLERNHKETAFPKCLGRTIGLRIGRYIVTDKSLSASAMFDRAGLAETSVKGRYDTHIAEYDESMRNHLIYEQQIVNEMKQALHNGEFEVWLQPQYNHTNGALIGSEALVRWFRRGKGLVQPGDFIHVFEQNGFIYELDKYVWERVCILLRKWSDEGLPPLPVSVNISRCDIFREGMFEALTGLVEKYELPVDLLRLEITESAFAGTSEIIIDAVKRLMDYGFTVEIDDFGSGYSSLNTLKDVPASVLKLDMRFLESNRNTKRGGNILESIVRMAKWLGMTVIAEGVETVAQADFLKSIGCNFVQGYLYSRPMPVTEFESLFSHKVTEPATSSLETVDNLDNNSFWDPESMDTLIFNSYVGGACIFEYHNGKIELLRANDKYAHVIGSAGMSIEDALKLKWEDHMSPEGLARLDESLRESLSAGDEITSEFLFKDLPGCPETTYLRSSLRVIANSGDRYLVYCTNENITAQRNAEQKDRNASEQMQRMMTDAGCGITATVINNGKLEYIVANNKFFEILGYTREQFEAEVKDSFDDLIYPEDAQRVRTELNATRADGRAVTLEYRVVCRNGEIRWVRSNLSSTSFTGIDLPVQLCVLSDITAEKASERALYTTDEQLRFLNEVAHMLLSNADSDEGINTALEKVRDYFIADRAYILEFFFEKGVVDNSYEVCAPGIKSEIENLQGVPIESVSSCLNAFESEGFFQIEDVAALDDDRPEKDILLRQSIKSLITVPLIRDGEIIGCIGVDNPKINSTRIKRFVALGDYLSVMLTRRDLKSRIRTDSETLRNLMNDTPGGFCRIRAFENSVPQLEYANDGFCKLMHLTRDEVYSLLNENAWNALHPDDVKTVSDAYKELMNGDKTDNFSLKHRLRCGSGDYIAVAAFCRLVRNDKGESYINAYYTPIDSQTSREEQRRKLLDNLPFGAALYYYKDGKLTAGHINRRYRELVGRERLFDHEGDSVLDAIHPDDSKRMLEELNLSIIENRNAFFDARLLCGDGKYRPFHIVANTMKDYEGGYSVYASYESISEEKMNLSRTMPFILSAIMESSTDLTFAKDANFKYICCSRSFAKMSGFESEDMIVGKTDFDIYSKEIAEKYRKDDEMLISEGKPLIDMIETIPSFDGVPRYSCTSKHLLRDADGEIIGLYGVGRDITENREAYSQLKLLTDSIPGGLATHVYSDNKFKLFYFNDGFCRLFGYSYEEYVKLSNKSILSRVFEQDLPELQRQISALIENSTPINCAYRVHTLDGGYRWINHNGVVSSRNRDSLVINSVIFDVTEQQEINEQLRVRDEEYRIAMRHSGNIICRFNIVERSITTSPEIAEILEIPERVENIPYSLVQDGYVSPETADDFISFYNKIINGEKDASVTFRHYSSDGDWHWLFANSSTIFSKAGTPTSAVISFYDITEQREKETVYKKWQQSLDEKPKDSYTLFRCNLNKNTSFDVMEGSLLNIDFSTDSVSFNDRTAECVEKFVFIDDRERYAALLNSDSLLAGYYRGKRTDLLEFREVMPDGEIRWLRLSIELVEYPNSTDIEAYLMYENIDDTKKAALLAIERAETDPLTGVLNRTAFAAKVAAVTKTGKQHALLMLDVDGFKLVNDVFGHAAGDQSLIDIAKSIGSCLRRGDLLGRLGGDEFVILLKDIPDDFAVAEKAKQICGLVRKSFSLRVQISASIGVAFFPRDGKSFEELYKKADDALYHVKGSGKDGYTFFNKAMKDRNADTAELEDEPVVAREETRRKMLIVEDNRNDCELLANMFKQEYYIEKATNGAAALIKMRHYGTAISVVLLDLGLPGMDGFSVLEKIQASPDLISIPVVVVSSSDDRKTSLRAIRCGATDYVTKPVDPELLQIRVSAAVSKAENERLRAQNSYLTLQSSAVAEYKAALERSGTVLIRYDWIEGDFFYDPSITNYVAGTYDNRKFWHILLADMVADTMTVKRIQELVHRIAESRHFVEGSLVVPLKTPSQETHLFNLSVYNHRNEFSLTDRIMITLKDTWLTPEEADKVTD